MWAWWPLSQVELNQFKCKVCFEDNDFQNMLFSGEGIFYFALFRQYLEKYWFLWKLIKIKKTLFLITKYFILLHLLKKSLNKSQYSKEQTRHPKNHNMRYPIKRFWPLTVFCYAFHECRRVFFFLLKLEAIVPKRAVLNVRLLLRLRTTVVSLKWVSQR